jgi:hypothetical protein
MLSSACAKEGRKTYNMTSSDGITRYVLSANGWGKCQKGKGQESRDMHAIIGFSNERLASSFEKVYKSRKKIKGTKKENRTQASS